MRLPIRKVSVLLEEIDSALPSTILTYHVVAGENGTDEFAKRSTLENFTYFKPATVFVPTNAAFEALLEAIEMTTQV